eukprot:11789396-Karenia_brevis.AAC.1
MPEHVKSLVLVPQPWMPKKVRVQKMTRRLLTFHVKRRLRSNRTLHQACAMTQQTQSPAVVDGCSSREI